MDLLKVAGMLGASITLVIVAAAAAISKSGGMAVKTPTANGKIDDMWADMNEQHQQLRRDLYNDMDRRFREVGEQFADVKKDVRELRNAVYRRWPRRDDGDE